MSKNIRLAKRVIATHTFTGEEFEAYHKAEKWVKDLGYSVGNMCGEEPTALMHGNYEWIAKWKNLTTEERNSVHGVIEGDKRKGPVTVMLFEL